MQESIIISLPGQVPAQKNGKQLFINRRTGNHFITSNQRVKDWQLDTSLFLRDQSFKATGKVRVSYLFYVKDKRRRDIDNMIATVNDALVLAGMLVDDSWQFLEIGYAVAQIDRENPGVDIKIVKLDEETKPN